jgi:hypothetical protein
LLDNHVERRRDDDDDGPLSAAAVRSWFWFLLSSYTHTPTVDRWLSARIIIIARNESLRCNLHLRYADDHTTE